MPSDLLLPHHQGGEGGGQLPPGGRSLQGSRHQRPRPVGRQLAKCDLQREGPSSAVELEGRFGIQKVSEKSLDGVSGVRLQEASGVL